MTDLQGWSIMDHEMTAASSDILEEAFLQSKMIIISSKLSKKSREFIDAFNSLEDMRATVEESMRRYQEDSKSTVRSWLYKVSQRIHYYGHVLDVLVQHHPEYVSLAWGTMKIVFMMAIEHESTTAGLAKALTEIGDLLPQVQLTVHLYSNPRVGMALAKLYASIMQLLVRALKWFESGKFSSIKRMAQSVISPFEIRFDDILKSIQYHSRVIKDIGLSTNQVEVRSIKGTAEETYRKVDRLSAELTSIKEIVTRKFIPPTHANAQLTTIVNSAALVNTNNRLTDLQFSQILTSISDDLGNMIRPPSKSIQYLNSLRQRQILDELPSTFYNSLKLRNWTKVTKSDICLIMGNLPSRFALRYFCLNIIDQLRDAGIPFLVALKTNPAQDTIPDTVSSIDIFKYLVKQALEYTQSLQTEGSMALSCAHVGCAKSETEWFDILGSLLAGFDKQVYIIVDLGMLDRRFLGSHFDFSWLRAFEGLFTRLKTQRPNVRIKVMLVNYSSIVPFSVSAEDYSKYCIPVRAEVTTVRFQKITHYMKTDLLPLKINR